MGHSIQGIVAPLAAFDAAGVAAGERIKLPQGFALMLAVERTGLEPTEALAAAAARVSTSAAVAYVATDYFGGDGEQAAGVWRDGAMIRPIESGRSGTVNNALQAIGVTRFGTLDEFDSIGLGRYRDHDDWRAFQRYGKAPYGSTGQRGSSGRTGWRQGRLP